MNVRTARWVKFDASAITLAGIVHNLVPVTLGNIVGGAGMVGAVYCNWAAFGAGRLTSKGSTVRGNGTIRCRGNDLEEGRFTCRWRKSIGSLTKTCPLGKARPSSNSSPHSGKTASRSMWLLGAKDS
ncbi:hypothetical protein ACH79_05050 [Bradyrhizobium sp. CCBAU 051011]|nr:hypothetical protein ACH79_05050 [Bradyrhizobium sp. CCBAU 051011]